MKIFFCFFFTFISIFSNAVFARWIYRSEIVGIDEVKSHIATTYRIESKTKDSPYKGKDYGALVIVNNPDEGGLKIYIFYEKANSICGQKNVVCKVKFDSEPSFAISYAESNNSKNSLLLMQPFEMDRFIKKVISHQKLKVEIKYLINPPDYLEFNISGFEDVNFEIPTERSPSTKRQGGGRDLSNYTDESNKNNSRSHLPTTPTDSELKEVKNKEINACVRWPDNKVVSLDSGYIKIDSLSNNPEYPEYSKYYGQEGSVKVKFVVATNGSTINLEIIKSSGHKQLDSASINAIRAWQFIPAKSEGETVNCWTSQEFNFHFRAR